MYSVHLVKGNVVLQGGDYATISGAIPHAVCRNNLIGVKHRLEETWVLRNLGYEIPSPITHWDYPGKYPPRENQKHTAAFATLYKRAFILNEMRTGKTAAAIWAAEYLLQQGLIRNVLIVCPKSCMQDVWAQALFECVPYRGASILHGDMNKRRKMLGRDSEFSIINHDGLTAFAEKSGSRVRRKVESVELKGRFDLIIFDEADVLCNHKSQMYRALETMLLPDTWLWLLTGTPIPNKYADAWGLLHLVRSKLPYRSFSQFRDAMMYRAGPFKWVNRDRAKDELFKLMQPAIRFTQKECFDLPKIVELWRSAELSPEQRKLYTIMQRDAIIECSGVEVTAVNAAVKMSKLLQISCGAVKDQDGAKISIDAAPRLQVLHEVLQEAGVGHGKKAVVFMPFKYTMEDVAIYLQGLGYNPTIVNGDVSEVKRRQAFKCFKEENCDVLVAHPEVTAHGLDLTVAETLVWYAPCFGNRLYAQGNMRHQGEKQKGLPTIVHITATQLEKERFATLRKGGETQAEFLDMYNRALTEAV